MRRVLAVLALGAAAAACSEQATSPQPRTPAISADFTNNLDNGNPRIWRMEGSYWWIGWNDGRYQAWHLTSPMEGMDPAFCGSDSWLTTGSQVVWPNQVEWWTSIVHSRDLGQLWVVVLDRQTDGPCRGMAVVAQGLASFRATDTDVLDGWWGMDNGRPNSSVETFQSEGDLTTPAGATVRYNGHLHLTLDADYGAKNAQAQIVVR